MGKEIWYILYIIQPCFLILGLSGVFGKEAEKIAEEVAEIYGYVFVIVIIIAVIVALIFV